MAFASAAITAEPRKFSIGPYNIEVQNISAVSGDTSGTVTALRLSRVDFAVVAGGGFNLSAQPTITNSGSAPTVALAFPDPVANIAGQIIMFGR